MTDTNKNTGTTDTTPEKKSSKRGKYIVAGLVILGLGIAGASYAGNYRNGGGGCPFGGQYGMNGGRGGMMDNRGGHMQFMMDKFDTDGDGAISLTEIETGLKDRFKTANTDGDDKLTLEEFQTLWTEASRNFMVRSFQHLDSDGKGYLTEQSLVDPILDRAKYMDRDGDGKIEMGEVGRRGKSMRNNN